MFVKNVNICVNQVISYRIMGVGCNISFPLLEDTNVEVSKANFVVNLLSSMYGSY